MVAEKLSSEVVAHVEAIGRHVDNQDAEIARLRSELQTSQNICQAAGIRDGNLITALRAELNSKSNQIVELQTDAVYLRTERDAARDSAKEWDRIAESQLVGLRTMQEALAGAEIALARDENIEAAMQIITKTRAALSRLSSPGAQQVKIDDTIAKLREALIGVRKDLAPIHFCDVAYPDCKICQAVTRIDEALITSPGAPQRAGEDGKCEKCGNPVLQGPPLCEDDGCPLLTA